MRGKQEAEAPLDQQQPQQQQQPPPPPSPAHTRPVTTCRRVCIRLPIVVKYLELKIRLDDATEEEQHGRVWQVWHVGRPDEQFPGRSSAR